MGICGKEVERLTPDLLFERHGKQLLHWARRFTRTFQDAEDCYQEAAIRIIRFWDQRRDTSERGTLTWAMSVVKNQAFDLARRQKSRGGDHQPLQDAIPDALAGFQPIFARLAIVQASRGLTARSQAILADYLQSQREGRDRPINNTEKVKFYRMRVEMRRILTER